MEKAMRILAMVMGAMGAYGETPSQVRARCEDVTTATQDRVTVHDVAVGYLPTEGAEKGFQYYEFTADEAESQKLWDIEGDKRCTAVRLGWIGACDKDRDESEPSGRGRIVQN